MLTVVFTAIWEIFLPESEHTHEDLIAIGSAVRLIREQRSISAECLASATGVAVERIAALEAGRLDPTYELLLTLAAGLEVQASAIVALAEERRAS